MSISSSRGNAQAATACIRGIAPLGTVGGSPVVGIAQVEHEQLSPLPYHKIWSADGKDWRGGGAEWLGILGFEVESLRGPPDRILLPGPGPREAWALKCSAFGDSGRVAGFYKNPVRHLVHRLVKEDLVN